MVLEEGIGLEKPQVQAGSTFAPRITTNTQLDSQVMAQVLVTGSTGFVGAHTVGHLVSAGHHVRCLVRPQSDRSRIGSEHVEFAVGDISDRDSIKKALEDIDVVYHLSGATKCLKASSLYQVNAGGTENLLASCAERMSPPTVVCVSSLAAAGPSTVDCPRMESETPQPVSHYGRSKLAGEAAASHFADRVPLSIVRPPIVMGEYDRDGLAMFKGIASLGLHCISGFADHRFSVIHAADLAVALHEVATRGERVAKEGPVGNGVYFVDGSEKPTYAALGSMIGEALGRQSVHMIRIPQPLLWTIAFGNELVSQISRRPHVLSRDKVREAGAGSWTCCVDKISRELGFAPRKTLQQRLNQTALWYRRQGWIGSAKSEPGRSVSARSEPARSERKPQPTKTSSTHELSR